MFDGFLDKEAKPVLFEVCGVPLSARGASSCVIKLSRFSLMFEGQPTESFCLGITVTRAILIVHQPLAHGLKIREAMFKQPAENTNATPVEEQRTAERENPKVSPAEEQIR